MTTGTPCTVIDWVLSSYVSNIRALRHLRKGLTSSDTFEKRALWVQMPQTPHMPDYDLSDAVETNCVQAIWDSNSFRTHVLVRRTC